MNVLNRLAIGVLLIAVIVLGFAIAVAPEALLAATQRLTTDAVQSPPERIITILVGAALAILGALALYAEFRPQRTRTVVVTRLSDGTAALEVSSIAQRLRQHLEGLEGVRQVTPTVTSRGSAVDVKLVVLTANDVDIPAKAAEISEAVREAVGKMGVGLGRQQVNLRYEAGSTRSTPRT